MANFFIQIDKPFYFAGDTVSGNILVNVVQPLAATGISLKFTGYECVKWNSSHEIVRPHHVQGQPPPPDPIAAIPPHLIYNSDVTKKSQMQNFTVSDVEEADNKEYDHRPQYIRTSAGRVFKMSYFETRNVFTSIKTMVYSCNGLAPGQYSFPLSFKTFEGWPASFDYNTPRKKGRIIYRLAANVEPVNPKFELAHAIEINLRETRQVAAATKKSVANITTWQDEELFSCCIGKGTSAINVHFEKDGYMQNEDVRMIIEVDNSQCTADITGINMSVTNTVGLRSNASSTSDTYNVFSKNIAGMPAGTKMVGNEAIREGFKLMSNSEIKPTCSGKLLSSRFDLTVSLAFNTTCDCCGHVPATGINIIIFPSIRSYQLPTTFTSNWAPKVMPICNFVLTNTFDNFNLGAMSMQNNYPPPPPPPVMPAMNMAANMNAANNMANQQMNMANNMAMNAALGGGMNTSINTGGMGGPNMNMNMNAGGMNMNAGGMNMNAGGMNMNAGMGGPNMSMNTGGMGMGGMNASMNTGGMGGGSMNVNMSGGMGGMNMNMSGQPMMRGGVEMTGMGGGMGGGMNF